MGPHRMASRSTIIIVLCLLVLSSNMIIPNTAGGPVVMEPEDLRARVVQGGSTRKTFTVSNTGNETINGTVFVLKHKCGNSCPNFILERWISLGPNQSVKLTGNVRSHLENDVRTSRHPMVFEPDDGGLDIIGNISITVERNLLRNFIIPVALPLVAVAAVAITAVLVFSRRRSDRQA